MTTHMSELNDGKGADVDTEIMPLVKFLNKLGVKTVASSAGYLTPKVDGPAYVTVQADCSTLVELLFHQIHPMIAHMPGVTMQVMFLSGQWLGQIHIPVGNLEEVTKRVGCWVEMLHK